MPYQQGERTLPRNPLRRDYLRPLGWTHPEKKGKVSGEGGARDPRQITVKSSNLGGEQKQEKRKFCKEWVFNSKTRCGIQDEGFFETHRRAFLKNRKTSVLARFSQSEDILRGGSAGLRSNFN